MRKYKQLDYLKRCQICALWKAGYSANDIAKEVDVHRSTIYREFQRNMARDNRGRFGWSYKPDYAQSYADRRHKAKNKRVKFTDEVQNFVREKLLKDWSPEQISGYAKRHRLFTISHELIYRFILQDKKKGGNLYKRLRHQNKRYRKRYGSPDYRGNIKNRRLIDERPSIVDDKRRIGNWEIDTIIGKDRKQAIVSIVERVSKKTVLRKVKTKTAKKVTAATISGLRSCSDKVLTITSDNGSEFAYHEKISKTLKSEFYFAHPYSSWERGLNENTNGLVRQYIKKGSDLSQVSNQTLAIISDKLNNRPRKTLNYATPNEIFLSGE